MSNVLILGASRSNFDTIQEFNSQNDFNIIAIDRNVEHLQYLSNKIGVKTYNIDFSIDCDNVLKVAAEEKVVGIYSLNDHGLRTAAYVSNRMQLHGISMASAHASLDKGVMREVWRQAGVPQPIFSIIKHVDELRIFIEQYSYPVVIKPSDCGGGGRGVYVITEESDIDYGFNFAQMVESNSDRLIVEQYIEGIETSVEVLHIENELHVVAYSEKIKPNVKTRVAEHIYYPGRFSNVVINKIKESSKLIMSSLGLNNWMGHIEFIINNDIAYAIELGARVGGGHTFHPISTHIIGQSYPQIILSLITGRVCQVQNIENQKSACYSFFVTGKRGVFKEIDIDIPKLNEQVYISHQLWKNKGEYIDGISSSMQRLGGIISLGVKSNNLLEINRNIVRNSKIIIE